MIINADKLCGCGNPKAYDASMCRQCYRMLSEVMSGPGYTPANPRTNTCMDCGEPIVGKAKRCRPCYQRNVRERNYSRDKVCGCGNTKDKRASVCRRCYIRNRRAA